MLSAGKRKTRVRTTARGLALLCGLIALLGAAAPVANAQDPPPQDPGVTLRVFQLGGAPSEICTIKPGQTPNVDKLMPTIDWDGDAAFGGLTQNFVVHAIATPDRADRRHVHVPAEQRRRLRAVHRRQRSSSTTTGCTARRPRTARSS